MNGIDKIDNNSKFSNRPTATAENIEPKSNNSTSLPASSKSELHLQNSTVAISEEAKLLSKSTEDIAKTRKGNILPDYLQPPAEDIAPNPSAASGNTFDFLTASDRETVNEAFDYAVENNLDTEEVGLAAFFLANERHVEAMIASGVKYVVYEPELHGGNANSESTNSSVLNDSRDALTEKALNGKLFSDNPLLNQTLFLKALFNALNLGIDTLKTRLDNNNSSFGDQNREKMTSHTLNS